MPSHLPLSRTTASQWSSLSQSLSLFLFELTAFANHWREERKPSGISSFSADLALPAAPGSRRTILQAPCTQGDCDSDQGSRLQPEFTSLQTGHHRPPSTSCCTGREPGRWAPRTHCSRQLAACGASSSQITLIISLMHLPHQVLKQLAGGPGNTLSESGLSS